MKRWLGMDVFTAARSRLAEVFDAFERVFVSFSGGKDSGVVVQLALDIAREKAVFRLTCCTLIWRRGTHIPMPSSPAS